MHTKNPAYLPGVVLFFVSACCVPYMVTQKFQITGLNYQIKQLQSKIDLLSGSGVNEHHVVVPKNHIHKTFSPKENRQVEKETNPELRGTASTSRRRELKMGMMSSSSGWNTRQNSYSYSRSMSSRSMMGKGSSRSRVRSFDIRDYDNFIDSGEAFSSPSNNFQEDSSNNEELEQFVRELLSGLETMSSETNKLDLLTDELGNVARTLDNRRLVETDPTSRTMQEISNQNQFESPFVSITDGLSESVSQVSFQNNRLSATTNRMTELNTVLYSSVMNATARNANLQQQNQDLEVDLENLTSEVERLQNEKDRLLREIQELSGETEDLHNSLEQYAALNAQLSTSISDLSKENQVLNENNVWYSELNSQLNESIEQLQAQNGFLARQNEIYADLNTDLNVTAENLSGEVDRLDSSVDDLENQNNRLNLVVGELTDEVETLADLNANLEKFVEELSSEVDRLSNETNRLERTNNDLHNVVSFLDETANDIDGSFEAITSFLSEQIMAYRNVVVETLHNTYLQRVDKWDCGFQSAFNDQPFANSGNAAIPDSIRPRIMDYVEEQVLSELCLSTTDFESYMENRFGEPVFTKSHFVSAVQGYTSEALNYYFPDDGETGLTDTDWADAEYSCEKLDGNKRFSWTV